MRKWLSAIGFLVLTACVTINVYFPAAEAQEAAKEFIDKVIGDETPVNVKPTQPATDKPPAQPSAQRSSIEFRFDPIGFFIGTAQAQDNVDITIRTPAIQAIQDRMAERFQSQLAKHFDAGALGFGNDGLIVLHDASKVGLKDRVSVNQQIAEDNRDRNAVYREIAVANGHPEWEDQIRSTFAKQWVQSARSGWWYQDSSGAWKQK